MAVRHNRCRSRTLRTTIRPSPNGDVWVGTRSGAFRWNERLLTSWTSTNGLHGWVHAIAAATNGVTWFGTSKGLFRSEAKPTARPYRW